MLLEGLAGISYGPVYGYNLQAYTIFAGLGWIDYDESFHIHCGG